jgi:predicted CXXCH cytochrome family protein
MAILQNKRAIGWLLAAALVCLALLTAPPSAHAQAKNSCLECHSVLDPPYQIKEQDYSHDIHAQKGLGCADCHGGDPTSDENAMSRAAGFRGKPKRSEIPALCARCHADPAVMRRYNPSLRTDQLSQYVTSVHGKRLAAGDTKVAVCIDCHGVHGIRPASDPRATTHPLNVPGTCARCHANADYMKGYGIPTDQHAGYRASVHYAALTEHGDLSAPTCVTCHGNHGATPPGVASVQFVCANCHVFQAQLFAGSPHKAAFEQASLPGCVTCHSNHRILAPTDAMLGAGPKSICTSCHTQGDTGYQAATALQQSIASLSAAIARSDEILDRAERSGMEVSQAKLEQAQARDALTKARVNVHGLRVPAVDHEVQAGMKIAEAGRVAGEKALAEREYRRKGLGISVFAILAVLLGLWLYTRDIERPQQN